ncbi:hypothetical protein DFS33DRAFT_1375104 [Desarmillaria ectypa]|nr:hypothetical protein DFS33DRAFT_1375104 [Desarmillaria ectypa]
MTITDSKYVIDGLCFHLKRWENSAWVGISNRHSGDIGNEGVDALAGLGAQLSENDALPANLDIDHEFNVDGAKLSTPTQSQAYRLLQMTTEIREHSSTKRLVQQVTATIKEINGVEPLPSRLWTGFLWKALQNTFKIRTFWEHLGHQYAMRGECPHCKVSESMEHVLTECNIGGRATLWGLACELWERTGRQWFLVTLGVALGATLMQIKTEKGSVDRAATRLYRILMTETIHLIWKIRGDDNPMKWHTKVEVGRLWIDAINRRLTIDRLLVNKYKYGSRALTKATVLSTWKDTLLGKNGLPEDWIDQNGFLVGFLPGRKQPRGSRRA